MESPDDVYGGARFVPVLFVGDAAPAPAVGLAWRASVDRPSSEGLLLWLQPLGDEDEARRRFCWMISQPERWTAWTRLIIAFGPAVFDEVIGIEEGFATSGGKPPRET